MEGTATPTGAVLDLTDLHVRSPWDYTTSEWRGGGARQGGIVMFKNSSTLKKKKELSIQAVFTQR